MEYIFVLGKNVKLSVAEIICYFKSRNIEFSIKDILKDSVLVDFKENIDQKIIDDLGGTIKICKVLEKMDYDKLTKNQVNIDFESVFSGVKGEKIRFGISVYSNDNSKKIWSIIENKAKNFLKKSKIKMVNLTPSKNIEEPVLRHFEVLKKLMNRGGVELVIHEQLGEIYLSKTVAVHNPYEFQKRDIKRPEQRPIYSIPPRLAKILINISFSKPNDIILDPFCGLGTVLQEALLMGMNIRGIDINHDCINKAYKNLEWVKKEYKIDYDIKGKLIVGDSSKLSQYVSNIDAVATEPYLGPPLKEFPTKRQAESILMTIRPLYVETLKEINKILKSKRYVSMVFPNFEDSKGKISLDIENIAKEAGFIIVNVFEDFPELGNFKKFNTIIDSDPRHRTKREICILRRN